MPRGGARRGTPGTTYANRTDLNTSLPKTAAPGQTYGSGAAQMRAQTAMPMGAQPPPAPAGPPAPPGQPPVQPGQFGPLDRPTDRPGEPLTAGAPIGPGPNSPALPVQVDPLLSAAAALSRLGDSLPPMLRGVVQQLQAAHGNGQGA